MKHLSTCLRLALAGGSIVGSLWLTTHMPASSTFAASLDGTRLEVWHGLVVGISLLPILMAGLLARS